MSKSERSVTDLVAVNQPAEEPALRALRDAVEAFGAGAPTRTMLTAADHTSLDGIAARMKSAADAATNDEIRALAKLVATLITTNNGTIPLPIDGLAEPISSPALESGAVRARLATLSLEIVRTIDDALAVGYAREQSRMEQARAVRQAAAFWCGDPVVGPLLRAFVAIYDGSDQNGADHVERALYIRQYIRRMEDASVPEQLRTSEVTKWIAAVREALSCPQRQVANKGGTAT